MTTDALGPGALPKAKQGRLPGEEARESPKEASSGLASGLAREIPGPILDGEDLAEASEVEPADDRSLFTGDRGILPLEARIVLAKLFSGPYLDRSKSAQWTALIAYEDAIRQWLGEIFLDLVIDSDDGVAFARQLRPSELPEKAPAILRPSELSYFEAVMLLILRERQLRAHSLGDRALISLPHHEIKSLLELHGKSGETDLVAAERHVNAVIKRFARKYKILKKFPGHSDLYEISPVIRFIVSPELIEDLCQEFESIRARSEDLLKEVFGGDDAVIEGFGGESGPFPGDAFSPLGGRAGSGYSSRSLLDPFTGEAMPEYISPTPLHFKDDDDANYDLGWGDDDDD